MMSVWGRTLEAEVKVGEAGAFVRAHAWPQTNNPPARTTTPPHTPPHLQGKIEFGVINQSQSAFNHVLNDMSLVVLQVGHHVGLFALWGPERPAALLPC